MALPQFSMRELIDAGVHFGHKTKRWNPKMSTFLFGIRNDVHIIDLQQTVPLLHHALQTVREVVAKNGRVLFVGTKRQAMEPIAEAAKRCGQYYVNQRWLGGMLTNWQTIQASIKKLRKMEELLGKEKSGLTKKEMLEMQREHIKFDRSLGGIKDMGGLPDLIFIKLGIPVVAILDSNCSPDTVAFPIPGNDDATRAIRLYCRLISDAALDGLQQSVSHSGKDIGASAELPFAAPAAASDAAEKVEAKDEQPANKSGKGKSNNNKKVAPVVVKKAQSKLKDSEEGAEEAASEEPTEAAGEEATEAKAAKPAKKAAPKAAAKKKA